MPATSLQIALTSRAEWCVLLHSASFDFWPKQDFPRSRDPIYGRLIPPQLCLSYHPNNFPISTHENFFASQHNAIVLWFSKSSTTSTEEQPLLAPSRLPRLLVFACSVLAGPRPLPQCIGRSHLDSSRLCNFSTAIRQFSSAGQQFEQDITL